MQKAVKTHNEIPRKAWASDLTTKQHSDFVESWVLMRDRAQAGDLGAIARILRISREATELIEELIQRTDLTDIELLDRKAAKNVDPKISEKLDLKRNNFSDAVVLSELDPKLSTKLDASVLRQGEILDLLRREARRCLRWPVMRSRRPTFSTEERSLFERIQLGEDLLYALGQEKRSKWDPLTRLAFEWLEMVAQQGRFFRERQDRKYRKMNQQLYEMHGESDRGVICNGPPWPLEEWAEPAGHLPPFCKSTVAEWRPFVDRLFNEHYLTLLQKGAFKGFFEEEKVPSKRKQDIREALFRRLDGLAKRIRLPGLSR
jgi:hypothetical protein